MIAFDNGPADGDYVRYIEAMAKTAAINVAQSATGAMTSSASSTHGFDDTMTQARARQAATRRATTTPAAAAAVAKAMALQVTGQTSILPMLARAMALIVAGVLLVIIGLSLRPTSVVGVGAGIVLFIIGFRQAANATSVLRSRTGNRSGNRTA